MADPGLTTHLLFRLRQVSQGLSGLVTDTSVILELAFGETGSRDTFIGKRISRPTSVGTLHTQDVSRKGEVLVLTRLCGSSRLEQGCLRKEIVYPQEPECDQFSQGSADVKTEKWSGVATL